MIFQEIIDPHSQFAAKRNTAVLYVCYSYPKESRNEKKQPTLTRSHLQIANNRTIYGALILIELWFLTQLVVK